MIDLVKKTMLASVGLAVVTKDKVLESLDELVQKGKLTKEEAAAIDMLNRANVVTKDQYDALAARVTDLEGKLHKEFPNSE
jgi:polyhydroxyalkanoate synthesis regulator phasin